MGPGLTIGLTLWIIFGPSICFVWNMGKSADGWELCNPYWAYKYHEDVNWFGAIMLSLLHTVLCPIGGTLLLVL